MLGCANILTSWLLIRIEMENKMMTSFVKKSVVALVAVVGLSAPSYAQLDGLTGVLGGGLGGGSVPMVGDILGVGGVPVVGDLLNGVVPVLGSLVGGDVLGDVLGGSLIGLGGRAWGGWCFFVAAAAIDHFSGIWFGKC